MSIHDTISSNRLKFVPSSGTRQIHKQCAIEVELGNLPILEIVTEKSKSHTKTIFTSHCLTNIVDSTLSSSKGM